MYANIYKQIRHVIVNIYSRYNVYIIYVHYMVYAYLALVVYIGNPSYVTYAMTFC